MRSQRDKNAAVVSRALLLALGATEAELEPAMGVLGPQRVAATPAGALEQARDALTTIRTSHPEHPTQGGAR